MFIFALSGFINAVLSIIFGSIIYSQNRKRRINRIFGLMGLSIAIWGFSYGMWQLSEEKEIALFWTRMLSLGSNFIPILFLDWVLSLLDLQKEKKRILVFGYLLTFLFVIFNFTSLFVKSVEPEMNFPWWPRPGILYHFYIFLGYFGLMGYGINLLFKTYRKISGYKREQIKYTIAGVLLGVGGGATNFLLWYGIPFPPYGTFLVPLYPFILGYAMSRYRLMDIRFVLGKGAIYILSLATVMILAFLLMLLINKLFGVTPLVH